MKRRDFMMLVGGAAAWPVASSLAQHPERVRRIGVLNALAEGDPEASARHVALEKALKDLGWVKGANVQLDYRSAEAKSEFDPQTRRGIDRSGAGRDRG
jgi:putative ABC transport system substrate-binding protein